MLINSESPQWSLIPTESFEPPQAPAAEVVRKGIRGLIGNFRRKKAQNFGFADLNDLIAVPPYLLDRIASQPENEMFVPVFNRFFDDWSTTEDLLVPVRVVVYPPMTMVKNSLEGWAREKGWWVLEPPSFQEILSGGENWLSNYEHDMEKALLIPDLSHIFLRHHAGLDLVRQLLNWLWLRKRQCLIGCSSWAWAYLSKSLNINTILPQPLSIAPVDATQLENWFELQAEKSDRFGFKFRQMNNGKPVFLSDGRNGDGGSDYLKKLTAYSRGNPGVAWAIWRVSLQYGVDDSIEDKALEFAERDKGRTIWVKDLDTLDLPQIPLNSQEVMFVLHAILLHNGLPVNELIRILPLSAAEVMQTLHLLKVHAVVEEVQERWQVTALAYPSVRRELAREGFLSDDF